MFLIVYTLFLVFEFEFYDRAFNLLLPKFIWLFSIPNMRIFKFRMCPLNDRGETLTASEIAWWKLCVYCGFV